MAKPQILIVEDESVVALDLQSSLERLGYEAPVAVSSGEEAIAEAEEARPDLVLMDIMLEGDMDGVEAAEQIHERFKIPVVYLTAFADDDTLRRAKITEPFGYLLKPFDENELRTTIEIALYKHRTEQVLRRRDAILEAVGFAAEQFLRAASWQETIEAVLERLGQTLEASRISIFQNHIAEGASGTLLASQRCRWLSPDMPPLMEPPELQEATPLATSFGRWVDTLGRGQIIHGHVRDFPAGEREILARQGARSLLVVPIFAGQAWWGFIRFDECRSEREWSAAEISALKMAASTLAAAIQRTYLHNQIQQRVTQIHTLYTVVSSGMTSIRLDEVLNGIVGALQKAFSADSVAILLVAPETNELVLRASIGLDPGLQALRRPIGVGIPGRVVQSGQPILLADVRRYPDLPTYDPDTVSALCVALQVGQRIIGAVNLESRRRTAFGKDDMRLVSILAGHLAAVIQNAYLFEEMEQVKLFNEGIVQGVAEAILLEDAEGIVTFANPAAEKLLGYSREEFIGLHWAALVPEDEREKVRVERTRWLRGIGSRSETALRSKTGQLIPVIASIQPLFKGNEYTGILAAFSDTSQYKASEEMSRRYEFIVNTSEDFMALIGRDYTYEAVNEAYCRAHQEAREGILHKTVAQIWGKEPFNSTIKRHLDECFAGSVAHYTKWFDFSTLGSRCMDVTYYPYYSDTESVSHAVVVSRDVTDLQRAAEAEKELAQMKDDFVANVSHELRTPLASVSGYLQLLTQGKVEDPVVQQEFLTRAAEDADRLTALVEDLLDMARLEAGCMQLELEEVDVSTIIVETLQSLQNLAAGKGISLVGHTAKTSLIVSADRRRLEQVLVNLVVNAIKFSEPQRAILVTGEAGNNLVTVKVQDRGPGIPAEALPQLFGKFSQLHNTKKRAGGGAGLGLYISKQIVESHGGHIGVDSKVGEGSTFYFSLRRLINTDVST